MSRFGQGCGNPNCEVCSKVTTAELPISPVFHFRPDTATAASIDAATRQAAETRFMDLLSSIYHFTPELLKKEAPQNENVAPGPPAEETALRRKVEKYFLKTEHAIAWDDVIGNEAARDALVEAIEHPVTQKDLYAYYGIKPPKGALLFGPPGCGKTMLGKAAAAALVKLYGTEDVPLLKINGPEIQTAYIGDTEQIIRDIFAYARAFFRRTKRRLVIFIDEADAILPTRDGSGGRRVHAWEESQVATFLTEMDGIEESGAFVILATNRPHAIDAALLRDGRCDRKIKVLRPDRAAAEKILTNAFKNVPATGDMATGTGTMASKAADAFFDPSRRLGTIIHSNGIEHLTLGHIVNGAMLNGLVEQAKAVAFRRDLAAGTRSGLCFADVESAIVSILEQNRRLNHFAAVEDLVETLGLTLTDAEPRKKSHALH